MRRRFRLCISVCVHTRAVSVSSGFGDPLSSYAKNSNRAGGLWVACMALRELAWTSLTTRSRRLRLPGLTRASS